MEAKKEEPCRHFSFMQERQGMFHTGDYICRDCGETLTEADVRKIKEGRGTDFPANLKGQPSAPSRELSG